MAEAERSSGDVFELETIRRLVELMKEHDLSELDLRNESQQIRLCRGGYSAPPPPAILPPPPQAAASASAPTAAREDESGKYTVIKSPMVGTFYSRANPNAAAYVKVGDHVEPDTTVCIIEAMKVFNEIPAEVRGRIVAVLVDDEEPVEFGKPLFKVDTGK